METRSVSLWKTLDWVTIVIYLLLIIGGWFSVCGASYDYGDRDFLDFSTRAGRQFVWIICSFGLGFILLMLEERMYDMFAYLIYIGMILLLIVTIFIAPDTKGSRSWLILGPVSLQPDSTKLDSLVIAHQPRRGEYVPGPCTHRPSSHGSRGYLKCVTARSALG